MWAQGLQFENLVSEGQKQVPMAFCFTCRAVSKVPPPYTKNDGTKEEIAKCPVCNDRWLIGTPDYLVDDIIHESKQTRKSRRNGPQAAPWWTEQLQTYIFFQQARHYQNMGESWGREVVNWLMDDYSGRTKGMRPKPPRSVLEAYRVTIRGDWHEWEAELHRRKALVEGPDMPPLAGMNGRIGEPPDSPRYDWNCPSCRVGKAIGCENWRWDDEDRAIIVGVEHGEDNVSTPVDNAGPVRVSVDLSGDDAINHQGTEGLA
jgi:hypothetical protein